jgi:hypothetical protein
MFWPGCKAVQSKPGLIEYNVVKETLVLSIEITEQVSPATTVYVLTH